MRAGKAVGQIAVGRERLKTLEAERKFGISTAPDSPTTGEVSKLWNNPKFGTVDEEIVERRSGAKDGSAQAGLSGSFASKSGGSTNSSRMSEEHPAPDSLQGGR